MSHKPRSAAATADTAKYTCSMHPQIVMDHADLCPLCGMDLTPVRSNGGDGWEDEAPSTRLVLSETARQMADVGSVAVGRRELFQEIRTVGRVEVDETRVASVAARISGPVVQVFAGSPGMSVRRGEKLASIRSSEVLSAEHQFLWRRSKHNRRKPGSHNNRRRKAARLRRRAPTTTPT